MNFINLALFNLKTTIAGVAPLVIGLLMAYDGFKSKDPKSIGAGLALASGGAGLVMSKDSGK